MGSVLQISNVLRVFRREIRLYRGDSLAFNASRSQSLRPHPHHKRCVAALATSSRHDEELSQTSRKQPSGHTNTSNTPPEGRSEDSNEAQIQRTSLARSASKKVEASDEAQLQNDKPVDGEQLGNIANDVRQLMRKLPSAVVVVSVSTSTHHGSDSANKHDHSSSYGVTISSFNTVTLGPPCMVSFNLRKPSRTFDSIQSSKFFRVSIFEGSEDGKAIANAFLKLQHSAAYAFLQSNDSDAVTNETLVSNSQIRAPRFKSAIASLSCTMDQCIDVGDHVILVAKVVAVIGPTETDVLSRVGLLYFDGDFGRAQPLEQPSEKVGSARVETVSKRG